MVTRYFLQSYIGLDKSNVSPGIGQKVKKDINKKTEQIALGI